MHRHPPHRLLLPATPIAMVFRLFTASIPIPIWPRHGRTRALFATSAAIWERPQRSRTPIRATHRILTAARIGRVCAHRRLGRKGRWEWRNTVQPTPLVLRLLSSYLRHPWNKAAWLLSFHSASGRRVSLTFDYAWELRLGDECVSFSLVLLLRVYAKSRVA